MKPPVSRWVRAACAVSAIALAGWAQGRPNSWRPAFFGSASLETAHEEEAGSVSAPQAESVRRRSSGLLAQLFEAPAIEPSADPTSSEIDRQMERLERSLVQTDRDMMRSLASLAAVTEQRVGRFQKALGILGLTAQDMKALAGDRESNKFSIPLAEQGSDFGRLAREVAGSVDVLNRLRRGMMSFPTMRPAGEEARLTSGFGYRIHPIAGVLRLHAGLDLAGPVGTPIRAAGSGVVLTAGWGGGFGNFTQIDHGNGVISRYAHQSEILVAAGQPVAAGEVIGAMGSTGQSTGSHLHFETRVRTVPANPACFILAGDSLAARLSSGLSCEKAPFSSPMQPSDGEEDET